MPASLSLPLLAIVVAFSDDVLVNAAPRVLHATRLVGALVAATLVPLLIDRRLRR